MIEFSPLGFIGKLFKTSDLTFFINMFILFSNYRVNLFFILNILKIKTDYFLIKNIKPVDMLHSVVLDLIACNPSKDNSKCEENLKKISKKYASSLFQHIGIESSLKGKTQKIKVIN